MKKILIYRHPNCEKCARIARVHHGVDWLDRIEDTTATPPTGTLRMGEIVVEERDTGKIFQGAEGLVLICRHIPLYWPLLVLLWIPPVRARADQEMRGCSNGSCQVAGKA